VTFEREQGALLMVTPTKDRLHQGIPLHTHSPQEDDPMLLETNQFGY